MYKYGQTWANMDKNRQNLVRGLGAGKSKNETRLVSRALVHCNETALSNLIELLYEKNNGKFKV